MVHIFNINNGRRIKGVVSDLYHTLIYLGNDPKAPPHAYYSPYTALLHDLGYNIKDAGFREAEEIILTQNFSGFSELATKLKPDHRVRPERIKEHEMKVQKALRDPKFFPDERVPAALGFLRNKKYRLGIISNVSSPYKSAFYDSGLGLRNFIDESNCIFSCDTTEAFGRPMRKPDSYIYEEMCNKLGLEPEEILFVGNNLQMDYIGPRIMKSKAGIFEWKTASPDERRDMEKGGMHSVLVARDGAYKSHTDVVKIDNFCKVLTCLDRR
ncbi:MAG: HAD family hydrolase [Candidatus Aenigmarchaeota archaeon]|nr:HAD family hydrolase [Candidatus Aenigmarchaeota archaeon]